MTPEQCRAARALLDWTQSKLAESAGLELSIVVDFERSLREVSAKRIRALRAALEEAGVEFIPENGSGAGVRFSKKKAN